MTKNQSLLNRIRACAAEEGFVLCGATAAVAPAGHNHLVQWIESGFAASMNYFAERIDAYQHPSGVLPGTKSIVALAYPYAAQPHSELPINHGKLARYTWQGTDYHDVIHPKLKRICRLIREIDHDANARGVVDTAPLMEREFAQLAGLGWRGKNTLLLNKTLGSYFFLACVLIDVELPYDQPHESSHCGTCTACLDACPTDAFPAAGVLDASRCISYLTIEHRESIDEKLRDGIGDWLFGCDICQEVCPWNRKPARAQSVSTPKLDRLELTGLFAMNDDDFRKRFRKTPLWRTKRRGLLRNAAIVLANQGNVSAISALQIGTKDNDPMIAEACKWAITKISNQ